MTATSLRTAAANLRALAGEAMRGPWENHFGTVSTEVEGYGTSKICQPYRKSDAALIAALGPTFALAVADWLDTTARGIDPDRMSLTESGPYVQAALAVAAALPAPVPAPLGDPGTPTP